ncbi:prephenate dehydratase [Nakamurella endophytica]|uniref:Prephenate dehydratase n=1 Tax=Nakamurella endophytica TaxID=1748367 RepID=A0A917T6E9_9ACTN|nr:prephenate dehydratase [Nakamurella endophytica]GGM10985.1 prephenate dehydratase [Nakamurella endophytica]
MGEQWSFLGPEGTFSEQAAQELAVRHGGGVELLPAAGVARALQALRDGSCSAAVVPLENSVEGGVPLTNDELTHGEPLLIAAEAFVPVTFQLLVRPGTALSQVRRVGSHPHGHAQVRAWLTDHLPDADSVVTDSTAQAAADVAAGLLDAAAAAPVAGVRYGLTVLADDIGLTRNAVTRFVLLRRPGPPPPPTGNDKSSLVLSVDNRPGTLLEVLAEIAGRGVNMVRLESRPARSTLGEYVFLVDLDGHLSDPAVADMVAALIRRSALLRWLGCYPRASGTAVPPPDHASDAAYADARDRVEHLLERGR